MKKVVDESSIATRFTPDVQKVAKQIEKSVHDTKAAVSAELEDGKIAAQRFLKRGRYAVEDCISETAHKMKQHPFSFLATAFAAGAVLGLLMPRYSRK